MREIRIEFWVLDALTEMLGLGRSVVPFTLPYVGETKRERAAHLDRAGDWLFDHGLLVNGEVRDDVADLLAVWARPEVLVTLDAGTFKDGGHFLVRAGWGGKIGFHSFWDDTAVVFEPKRPAEVPHEFVLPPREPFRGRRAAMIVDDPAVDSDPVDADMLRDSGRRVGGVRGQQGNVQAFLQHGFEGMGLLSLSMLTNRSKPPQRMETLSWFDTSNGRFAIITSPVGDGTLRRVFEPTDGSLLAWWISDRTA